jgi:DNA recombination protein RmuC
MVVRLAGGRSVIVDSKVPVSAFSEAQNAEDDAARSAKLDEHARQMRGHVNALSSKDYTKQFDDAPEFTVLFVPSDVILATAVEHDPSLMDYAVSRNVIIATPMTLIALLRTVAYAWRQEALAENAKQVYEVGKELYARLATMAGHVARAGKGLRTAVDGYNSMIGSLDRNVMTSARRMVDLELIEETRAIDEPGAVDVEIKSLTKEEFLTLDPPEDA